MPHLTSPIRVLIADDHMLLREGLASVLNDNPDMALVGQACNGEEAVAMFSRLRPDVVVLDLQMPLLNGIDALRSIMSFDKHARVLILTTYRGDNCITRALAAGAIGYILKSAVRHMLVDAITTVHAGKKYIPAEVAAELSGHFNADQLSSRERHVLQLVAQGNTNREIGTELAVTEPTIKSHMGHILAKLQARDRTHAVSIALQRGILGI